MERSTAGIKGCRETNLDKWITAAESQRSALSHHVLAPLPFFPHFMLHRLYLHLWHVYMKRFDRQKKKAEERWVEGRCNQVYVTWRCTGAGTQLDCRPIQNNPTGCASSSLQPVGTLHCSGNSSGLTILYVDLLYVLNAWKHKPLMSQLTQVSTLGVLKSEVHK